MRSGFRRALLAILVPLSLTSIPAHAAQVSNLTALVRNGQTFLTWNCPPGTGWLYRVYMSQNPIGTSADFNTAIQIQTQGDSSAYDRRLSTLTGTAYGYRLSPGTPELAPNKGLAVITPTTDRFVYYAVTVQGDMLWPEDRSILPGQNALKRATHEFVRTPVPVLQRTVTYNGISADVYTLWTTDVATPVFPSMGNVPGLAFDCAIVHPATQGSGTSLMVLPHRKGGSFLESLQGTNTAGEWVLALDDPLPNGDANTFWYGYHEEYDIHFDYNMPPVYGYIHDYTLQRILHTLGWARSSFGIDTTKVYACGYSMGGIGSAMLAFNRPQWIAAIMSVVGKYDFSFVEDPNPLSSFNPGNALRGLADRLWGDVSVNLPTCYGRPIYQSLNDGILANTVEAVGVPPIFSFDGKWDTTVGWAEKAPFYAAMQNARQAGFFFWDQRDHMGSATSAWGPVQDLRYLYRFRTNLSFPAITHCTLDGNPGNGDPFTGDSVGTINGFIEWDTQLVDEASTWSTTLNLRTLNQRWGALTPPDSVVADVTPRRLQAFHVVEGQQFHYIVTRVSDGVAVQQGVTSATPGQPLTVHGVKIYRTGSRLELHAMGSAGVDVAAGRSRVRLRIADNPVVRGSAIAVDWPAAGDARVELLDVAGRRMRTLFAGRVSPGTARMAFPNHGLPSGVYLISARLGNEGATGRAVVLR